MNLQLLLAQLAVDSNLKYAQFADRKSVLCYYKLQDVINIYVLNLDVLLLNKPEEAHVRIYEQKNNPLKLCFFLLY